jgi:hypothetical protein
MGLLTSAVAFLKAIGRLLKALLLLPVRIPMRLTRVLTSVRGASPASKALLLLTIVLSGVAGAGLFFSAQESVEVSASSAPLISAILEWATSGWGYVFAAIVFGRGTIWGIRRARIAKAAHETGYKPRTIARLAEEIRTTDETTRAIIFGDDTLENAIERIAEAFEGEDDRIAFDTSTEETESSAVTLPAPADQAVDDTVDQDHKDEPSTAERFKLWRMDLATGLRTDDVVWKLLVPAGIVLVVELILVQFWVQWWLYLSLLAGALVAGLIVYRGDQWLRDRRLRSLRQERGGETWEEIAVLVKSVETDEVTVHMGFLAGRTYASTDREELVETLATRALERSYGYHPSPSIEERYAWCLDRYILNFAGWRENMEKPAVMDHLVNEVLDSEDGMLPKEILAQRVIEHDREYIWQGLRFVGMGYDPDLVAECYEELVPNTLVEHELTIRAPDGDREVTAVRARTETLPPDVAQLRANFSDRFPIRKMPDRYELPSVEPDELTRGFQLPSGE